MTRKHFINKCQYYKIQRNEANRIADLVKERKVRSYDELYRIYKFQFAFRGLGRLLGKVSKGLTSIYLEAFEVTNKYLESMKDAMSKVEPVFQFDSKLPEKLGFLDMGVKDFSNMMPPQPSVIDLSEWESEQIGNKEFFQNLRRQRESESNSINEEDLDTREEWLKQFDNDEDFDF